MAMAPRALALLLLALTTAIPATSDARVRLATGGYILAECHEQAAAPSTSNGSDAARSAFRANLHQLLFDLPSAAGPTGFASLHYDNGPFVRGLCFDDSPQTGGCAGCLSAAAKKIADECGGSRRAGVWNAGCFVGYRDTNSSSPHEDAYRGREFSTDGVTYPAFYDAHELAALALSLAPLASVSNSGPMMATADTTTGRKGKVHAAAHCARDVTAADCARCLEKSAWELLPKSKCCGSWELDGQHEGVAVLAGFNCHLRLEIHAPDLPFAKKLLKTMKENVALFVLGGMTIIVFIVAAIGLIILIRMVRAAQQQLKRLGRPRLNCHFAGSAWRSLVFVSEKTQYYLRSASVSPLSSMVLRSWSCFSFFFLTCGAVLVFSTNT